MMAKRIASSGVDCVITPRTLSRRTNAARLFAIYGTRPVDPVFAWAHHGAHL
jgi:hypothetical protein